VPDTLRENEHLEHAPPGPTPGLLLLFSQGGPLSHQVPLVTGESLTLGRDLLASLSLDDRLMSARHAEVRWVREGFLVEDLGSTNGTFLQGARIAGVARPVRRGLLRLGQTVMLLVEDLASAPAGVVVADDFVIGPRLGRLLEQVARARREGRHLLLHGETGTGKELAARRYHQAGDRRGPFVPLNCASLQAGLAERLLFGSVKGVYSDAREAQGVFGMADGGVLFLDEVAELEPGIQAKLLRAVETGEIQRLGEAPTRVDVHLVAATHRNLRHRVASGHFREDLYMRLRQTELTIPPLRERPEEVAFLMQRELEGTGLSLHASAVEEVLLRPWPGNIRELSQAVRSAVSVARDQHKPLVRREHLDERAGRYSTPEVPVPPSAAPRKVAGADLGRSELEAALARNGGNKAQAARQLGLHRNQLHRLLRKHGLMSPADDEPDEGEGE
jgi:transcriptional regulator with GAF, ATPase, and Fis domain